LVTFLSGHTLLILLWFGGTALLEGAISPGDFVATLGYLQMLIWPMLGAGFTVNMMQRGAASLGRINEILNTPPGIVSIPGGRRTAPRGSITVRNLTYTFPDQAQPTLRDLSFDLPRGHVLGILGRTGSGKSTLIRILPRFLDPPENSVFLEGTEVGAYELNTLRSAFGVVSQDTFLFSATILDNILFARPDLPREQAIRAGTLAALDTDIGDFPAGWDTVVGERGITLSGGQRQRIAIARALLPDPEILILDDALSAVDTRTEERILTAVLRERENRTTLVISNRVSTLKHAGEILVMEDGRVAQRGDHESLASRPGFYHDIFRLQQLEEIRERT
ncbi:MAG: ABC transporter ATP-binding protein, partial [Spirochaetaceae bacterium]